MKKVFVTILMVSLLFCGCNYSKNKENVHKKPDVTTEYEQYTDLSFMSKEQSQFYIENKSLIFNIVNDATSLPYTPKMDNDAFYTVIINDNNYVIFDVLFDEFKSDLLEIYTENEIDWLTNGKYFEYNGYVAAIDSSMPILLNVEKSMYEVYENNKNRLVFVEVTTFDEKNNLNNGYLIEMLLNKDGWKVNYAGYKN